MRRSLAATSRIEARTPCARSTVVALRPSLISATHSCTSLYRTADTGVVPQRGWTYSRQAISTGRTDEGFRCVWKRSHAAPSTPIVSRDAVASTNSPRAIATCTEARKSSASRFVRNPRLSVCERSGFRYRTRYRLPAAVSYAEIAPIPTAPIEPSRPHPIDDCTVIPRRSHHRSPTLLLDLRNHHFPSSHLTSPARLFALALLALPIPVLLLQPISINSPPSTPPLLALSWPATCTPEPPSVSNAFLLSEGGSGAAPRRWQARTGQDGRNPSLHPSRRTMREATGFPGRSDGGLREAPPVACCDGTRRVRELVSKPGASTVSR